MPMPMPTVQQQQQPPQIVVVNTQPQYGGTGFHSRPAVITQQPHSTVVIHPVPLLGIYPQAANCPQCRSNITTSVTYEPSCKTHFFAGLICLLGCWLGCCLIPYCVDSCQAATHKCKLNSNFHEFRKFHFYSLLFFVKGPSCGAYLGKTD